MAQENVKRNIDETVYDQSEDEIVFDNSDFWFTSFLREVNWAEVFRDVAPEVTPENRKNLLQVASSNGISPTILLSAVIYNELQGSDKMTFKDELKEVSGRMVRANT